MTRQVVVPPLFDPSLELLRIPGDEVLDVNASFFSRLTGTTHLRRLTDAAEEGRFSNERTHDALLVTAAAAVLARGRHDLGRMRAIDLVLRLSSVDDPALRLSSRRLEVVGGTTQRGLDIVSAAAATRLFRRESDDVRTLLYGQRVHLLIENYQQLPASAMIMEALTGSPVVLCGSFAAAHRAALEALPPFSQAVGFDSWLPSWQLRKEWAPRVPEVRWIRRARDWSAGVPWSGRLEPEVAALFPPEAWEDCVGATLTISDLRSWASVAGTNGIRTDLRPLLRRVAGNHLAVELLTGAPGVSLRHTSSAARRLFVEAGPRLNLISRFRLPAMPGAPVASTWDGVPVRRDIQADHDFARWHGFTVPGSEGSGIDAADLTALRRRLSARTDLHPARFAASSLAPPSCPPLWDSSAALVNPAGGTDGPSRETFLVNLRTGDAAKFDPRLVHVVRRLEAGDSTCLDVLSNTARRRVAGQLARAGVMGIAT
ncbi:hypothetical protein ADK75_34260 [Streptomyces virginiae]|uniref:Uncharacterized protein n=1 Tax=Streptomyces virginiae TaxID=1961 RepID=A0A0L8M327_STRVG|nr:hypothetical protein [Streptomyces virginiae]KOG44790.1 hypothetical protein ADK75_34260 [Streptomyces virginiae]